MPKRANTLPATEPQRSNSTKKSLSRHATTAKTNPAQESKRTQTLTSPPPSHSNPKHSILHRQDTTTARASSSSSLPNTTNGRPQPPNRQNSIQTRYMTMLLALDTIPRLHNILASFFTWILLAGFIIFPGTFTSLSKLQVNSSDPDSGDEGLNQVLKSVKNIPLLAVAGVCCGIGAAGMSWLWWRWRENYVWLLNRIFLPGTLNSLAGLISTLINVYSQQDGTWSSTARVTAIVSGACMVVTAVLFALYNWWVLERVKKSHGRDMAMVESVTGEEEGFLEKVERKAKEPALEPGSVV